MPDYKATLNEQQLEAVNIL
ncbi:hypothetical protein CC1_22230 [Coprococcus catus GD/7]|uniref:Uncharacterized protein n=1 Tax=Coprococcus catus GD/7 TaxID=717962 RepID=D4J991_9FIRM|nr:hypothetical protein CC1_22230 [Coprococcus catus GD/7]